MNTLKELLEKRILEKEENNMWNEIEKQARMLIEYEKTCTDRTLYIAKITKTILLHIISRSFDPSFKNSDKYHELIQEVNKGITTINLLLDILIPTEEYPSELYELLEDSKKLLTKIFK